MNILFISFFDGTVTSGGTMCSSRNYESLKNLFGQDHVTLYTIKRKEKNDNESGTIWGLKNIFSDIKQVGFGGLDAEDKFHIIDVISKNQIDTVFLDSSLLGILAKTIKTKFPTLKVVTFFHNLEHSFFLDYVKQEKKYIFYYRVVMARISEKLACKYSDRLVVLNERDWEEVIKKYQRVPDIKIPISLRDSYHEFPQSRVNEPKIGLFVGSHFFANVQGISWFVQNVLPKVRMKLIIVGKDMDKLRNTLPVGKNDNIEIHSFVPDLQALYEQADFSILPIFLGGGMKVKTGEALMYGKYLIGTDEAFIGYNIYDRVGKCCNTAEEMISAIENLPTQNRFNDASKKHFLKYFSFEATKEMFRELMSFQKTKTVG